MGEINLCIAMAHKLTPPLAGIRAFEAAARHLSFKLAAKEMNLTASAVSHAVSSLEDFLRTKLFHRKTRQILLTDAGRTYFSHVTRAFEEINAATDEAAARSHADTLTVVCAPTISRAWLIPQLQQFLTQYPDIDLRLHAAFEAVVHAAGGQRELEELLSEDVDAAIVYGHDGWRGFVVDKLMNEDMVPLCSPSLRDGPPPLAEPSQLTGQVLIHTETKFTTWPQWLHAAQVGDIRPKRVLRFNRADLALQAAAAGLGVALENRIIAAPHLASGSLIIPFDLDVALENVGAYYFVCRPERVELPKIESFRAWIVEAAKTPPRS
jgi:LysR family glycine cleavage system transcriptional activator